MFSANSSQVSDEKLYVEDVFSTWLYAGNGSTQTITNGIDLSGKGGMVWLKKRSPSGWEHCVFDTTRGVQKSIKTNTSQAEVTFSGVSAFNSNGFTLGSDSTTNGDSMASWTFRKAPKFFDVVTYTGNGANRNIAHSLGVAPGTIIIKRTNTTADWVVYHRSIGSGGILSLNQTMATYYDTIYWNGDPTATTFGVKAAPELNASGSTYVAYLFAHDTTSDGIIQCGSFTTDGAGAASVTLGWEPQWCLVKWSAGVDNWYVADNMRGMPAAPASGGANLLYPNTTAAESTGALTRPNATGFTFAGGQASTTYIYIAIRRGPMRTPTSGTSVFKPTVLTNTAAVTTTNFPVDLSLQSARDTDPGTLVVDRMRGTAGLVTFGTNAENGYWGPITTKFDNNTGVTVDWSLGASSYVNWSFRRAPSFMDVVCYTGTGVARTINHNLGVAPELMIVKRRTTSGSNWPVYSQATGPSSTAVLNLTAAFATASTWNNTSPTSSVFSVNAGSDVNQAGGYDYVAYLFASCPGVSKVGSYTGNGSSQTINCGFTNGARFVMIKRTSASGSWFVWDTARGITSSTDPYLMLNNQLAEANNTDTIDPDNSGFIVNETGIECNTSGHTYIYLAVA